MVFVGWLKDSKRFIFLAELPEKFTRFVLALRKAFNRSVTTEKSIKETSARSYKAIVVI